MSDVASAAPLTSETVSAIGVRFDRRSAEARACRLQFHGSPLSEPPAITNTASTTLHADQLRIWHDLERDESTLEQRELLSMQLTSIALQLCQQLMSTEADEVLAAGIMGAGLWSCDDVEARSYTELVNTSVIAERLGTTVIDDFPGRDLAQGGRGGPLEIHGRWMLLADRSSIPGRRWRALLDIAPHVSNFSMIGPPDFRGREETVLSTDITVGSRLISEMIADRCRETTQPVDVDQLADNGTVIPELYDLWSATATEYPTWHPHGVSVLPLVYALADSVHAEDSVENLVATAFQFIATRIADHIKHRVPPTCPVGELLLMGDGSNRRTMVRLLNEQLPGVPVRKLSELGQDRTIHAASVAALTLLHIWQIPVPSTNGYEVPRVPGRITPGSPSNWRRVLHAMTNNAPWLLPLREAI